MNSNVSLPNNIDTVTITNSIDNIDTIDLSGTLNMSQQHWITGAVGSSIYDSTSITGTGLSNQNLVYSNSNYFDFAANSVLSIKGKNADIEINDKSLMTTLRAIEKRLGWLDFNHELEKEWAELKELADRYRELEKQCQEKVDMWSALKKSEKE
jgi:hypothetical protein